MAFAPHSFSKLAAFRPRAFIKAAVAAGSIVGQAGDYGTVALGQDTFRTMSFASRSLHGLRSAKQKRRMVGVPGKFDARGGSGDWR